MVKAARESSKGPRKVDIPLSRAAKLPARSLQVPVSRVVPITTFSPEPYRVRKHITAVVEADGEEYSASFYDANVHAGGETPEEALYNLKARQLNVFEILGAEEPKNLGPIPTRQIAVLREFIDEARPDKTRRATDPKKARRRTHNEQAGP